MAQPPDKNPASPPEFRGRVYDNITETIGATPLVRLRHFAKAHDVRAELLGKCEFFNPLSSVKDRIGLAMIEAAMTLLAPSAADAVWQAYTML